MVTSSRYQSKLRNNSFYEIIIRNCLKLLTGANNGESYNEITQNDFRTEQEHQF